MTQDEVNLIYDYLHENYEYRDDGNLVRIKDGSEFSKAKKGDILGSFFYQYGSPRMRCTLNIKGVNYTKNLSHFIYLYHYKEFPSVIEHKDNNPTNCRIDNLKSCTRVDVEFKKQVRGWKPITSSTGKIRYRVTLQIGKQLKVHFGSCETKEEARAVYDMAKSLHVVEKLQPDDIKRQVMDAFPHLRMKLRQENKCGYPGVYKRGNKYVSRSFKGSKTSTHDTPEQAHQAYLKAKEEYACQ